VLTIRTTRMDFRHFPRLLERMHIAPPPLQALMPLHPQMAAEFGQGTGEIQPDFVNPKQYMSQAFCASSPDFF
jgi:hypothetical protein